MNSEQLTDNPQSPISNLQSPPAVGRFLGGVGALIRDEGTGRYLLLQRAATKDFAAGVWECITGRVDQGEGFEEAVRREVREEVGLEVALEFLLGTTHFYRGTAVPENELIGVVYLCTPVGEQTVTLSAEHDAYRWVTAVEAAALLSVTDPSADWGYRLIKRAEAIRPLLTAELRRFNRREGFELG